MALTAKPIENSGDLPNFDYQSIQSMKKLAVGIWGENLSSLRKKGCDLDQGNTFPTYAQL